MTLIHAGMFALPFLLIGFLAWQMLWRLSSDDDGGDSSQDDSGGGPGDRRKAPFPRRGPHGGGGVVPAPPRVRVPAHARRPPTRQMKGAAR